MLGGLVAKGIASTATSSSSGMTSIYFIGTHYTPLLSFCGWSDIWKWLRRTKIDDTNCKCNHGKRKVDVWRWPHRKKEKKMSKRARNNDYELAEKSPKRGDKVGIELVILELLDLKREKDRPLSSLVNKEGQTKFGIKILFDGKAPSFRIANTLENYILTFETNGMEEGVTRLVMEVATTYRYGGLYGRYGIRDKKYQGSMLTSVVVWKLFKSCPSLNDTFVSIIASMATNPFEQTLFGKEHQWICEMNKFSMDSISGLCNFRIEYVGVQSDLNHDGGLVVCNQLVHNVQV
ncbi:hypothetical protein Tco_1137691 [Tanacetum coccineum]